MELIEKKTKVSTAQKYEKNPFIEAITIKTRAKKLTVARGGMIIDSATGEFEGLTEIAQLVEVDEGQFIKLFTKDLAVWFDLNKSGIRVFGCLLAAIQNNAIGRDIVYIAFDSEAVKEFGMSKQTFYRGLEELLTKGFIARHRSEGWYFINPAMFFNGNRARFVKEYRVKQQQELPLEATKLEDLS